MITAAILFILRLPKMIINGAKVVFHKGKELLTILFVPKDRR